MKCKGERNAHEIKIIIHVVCAILTISTISITIAMIAMISMIAMIPNEHRSPRESSANYLCIDWADD